MSRHSIVSSDSEELILVDADDRETGYLSKAHCHDGRGVLHRAFSLFIFNGNGELLLQQRAADKRLWPLYWSNSCCSHPRRGEQMAVATGRRLQQELGIRARLEFVYKFTYQASFGSIGSEHELCSVFLGRTDDEIQANDNEIAAVRFVAPPALTQDMAVHADRYTPWFRLEWQRLASDFASRLGAYCQLT
ncbi:MAG TPA: isopentenyl-diphosphate Delta-isomerase [Woeseiaceae bacterium]|nr:isopentenyl-diphosphate Delta-isomerase [Woeseiaceae bacterium]